MKKTNVLAALALACCTVVTSSPQAETGGLAYDGEWLGGIVFRHGTGCPGHWSPIKIHIWEAGGQRQASVDYPNENAFDLPFAELEFRMEEMVLHRENSSGDQFKFIGKRQGDIVEGDYLQNGERLGTFQIIHNVDSHLVKHHAIPEFEVSLLSGHESISKADLLGKYYLMDFWFTGCAICLK
ncbi:hypothetical protein MJD09_19420, partial [bacterium]|nr:hypothetical protein [bacterium]